jgi:hypothetical protein
VFLPLFAMETGVAERADEELRVVDATGIT